MPTYTIWNPSDKSADITLSNGDLTAKSTNNGHDCARTIISKTSGKWYWEITIDYDLASAGSIVGLGVISSSLSGALGSGASDYAYRSGGKKGNSNSWVAYGDSWTTGDIIGIAIDLDAGKIWFSKNGVWQASGDPASGTGEAFSGINDTMFGMFSLYYTDEQLTANFGASVFSYSVPSGFNIGLYEANEVVLTAPLSAIASLQSNIQVELVCGELTAETSISVSEIFAGVYVECPSPFTATSSLQAKTGLDIAVAPLVAQTNLQSNLQIELVPPVFTAQGELSVDKIFWGHQVEFPESFSANASLQANTQIKIVPPPLIATGALFSNLGIEVSAGILNATGAILVTPTNPVIIIGAPGVKRVYLFTLTGEADHVDDIVIPIKSFQSRSKTTYWNKNLLFDYIIPAWNYHIDQTYLSVVIPGNEYSELINARTNGSLILRMGYSRNSEILISEIIAETDFDNITINEGSTDKSIILDGYGLKGISDWGGVQSINFEGVSYKNITRGKLRYRCKPDLYLKPGNMANINDVSFTVEGITYTVAVGSETFEVSE